MVQGHCSLETISLDHIEIDPNSPAADQLRSSPLLDMANKMGLNQLSPRQSPQESPTSNRPISSNSPCGGPTCARSGKAPTKEQNKSPSKAPTGREKRANGEGPSEDRESRDRRGVYFVCTSTRAAENPSAPPVRQIVCGCRDRTVKVLERRSGPNGSKSWVVVHVLRGHTGSVLCVYSQHDFIISCSSDSTIRYVRYYSPFQFHFYARPSFISLTFS